MSIEANAHEPEALHFPAHARPIQTPRLILNLPRQEDANFILQLYNSPDFLRFIGDRGLHNKKAARHFIQQQQASLLLSGFGLRICRRQSDHLAIGVCGLLKDAKSTTPELGYALLPAFYHQGYMREACQAMLIFARELLLLTKITALVQSDNQPSKSLLEALGFRLSGHNGDNTRQQRYLFEHK